MNGSSRRDNLRCRFRQISVPPVTSPGSSAIGHQVAPPDDVSGHQVSPLEGVTSPEVPLSATRGS